MHNHNEGATKGLRLYNCVRLYLQYNLLLLFLSFVNLCAIALQELEFFLIIKDIIKHYGNELCVLTMSVCVHGMAF